jgi:hypothetical protein
MSFTFYKVLWIILHFVADLIEAIYFFGLEFRENFANYVKNITKERRIQEEDDEKQLIECHLNDLKKLPKHLAVILNANSEKDVDLRQLSNLVLWSLSCGVNFISFYDYKGKSTTFADLHLNMPEKSSKFIFLRSFLLDFCLMTLVT